MLLNKSFSLRFSAPAKINLDLKVVGRREDGYHLLSTLMTFISWQDQLEFQSGGEGVRFSCESALTDDPEDNLVLRAARRMADLAIAPCGVHIRLHKQLPVAAGLGGGSSDAATTLMVLNRLWQVGLSQEALLQEGLRLGADIPFFIGQQASRAEGVGERLTPVSDLDTFELVLINPGIPLSTKDVFRAYRGGLTNAESIASILGLPGETPVVNDLQPVSLVLAPVIGEMLNALLAEGAQLAAMSGSGPTVFGIFADPLLARQAVSAIGSRHDRWILFQGRTFNQHPFQQEWQHQTVT